MPILAFVVRPCLAVALVALAVAGCAEPTPSVGAVPTSAPAAPKIDRGEVKASLDASWRASKESRWSETAPSPPSAADLAKAAAEVEASASERTYLKAFYEARLGEAVFFDGEGRLTGAGKKALDVTRDPWTHGIMRPKRWPEVTALAKDLDRPEALEEDLKAPISEADLDILLKGLPPGEAPVLDVDRLTAETLAQLARLDTLAAARTERAAALDVGLVVALWRLDRAMRLPLPSSKFGYKWRHKARRKLAEMRQDNPVKVWPEKNLHLVAPAHPDYEQLRGAYARYRALHDKGALAAPPSDLEPGLTLGETHAALPHIRKRLSNEGFEAPDPADVPRLYDASLAAQVKAFQQTRGLSETGSLDKKTLAALAVPSEKLLERLRLGLHRWHSSLTRVADYYVRVNIPQYEVQLIDDAQVLSRYDAVVGKRWTQTPRFEGVIYRLEVHPWWWGVRDDPKRVPPGPHNPLGQLVFRVNPHHLLIFLHGTNKPKLLDRSARAFSHGCVRLREPETLGSLIIDRDTHPLKSKDLKRLMAGKRRTRKIDLRQPVPVFFEYNTTFVHPETGRVHFSPDIYRDDARQIPPGKNVLEALASWAPDGGTR